MIQFEWDAEKRRKNLEKHDIDFEDLQSVFVGHLFIWHDGKFDYGEDRWIGIGLWKWILVVVVFTEPDEETIRIISARKAKKHEKENYHKWLKNRLG